MSSIVQSLKDLINRTVNTMPLFIKIVFCSTSILYLLNLLIPYISLILADIPYYTIYYIQIWRLFTTPFMTTNILNVILSFYFWLRDAVKLEKEIGTIKYMLIFLMNSLCIQIIYCLVMFLLSVIIQNPEFLKNKITTKGVVNQGLWPILLCDLTLLCLSNPDRSMNFYFIPFVFKAKYYPIILLVIFTILSLSLNLEIFCGVGFAFLYHHYLRNRIKISNNFASRLSDSFLFKWMKNQKGYINNRGGLLPQLKNVLENTRNVNVNQKLFSSGEGSGIAVGSSEEKRDNIDNQNTSRDNEDTSNESRLDVDPNNSPK